MNALRVCFPGILLACCLAAPCLVHGAAETNGVPNAAARSPIESPEMGTNSSPKDIESARLQGAAAATKDIKAGELRILYVGKPWSSGKPLIDDATGCRVQIVGGCVVTEAFVAEVEAYNKTMREWHAKTKKQKPLRKP